MRLQSSHHVAEALPPKQNLHSSLAGLLRRNWRMFLGLGAVAADAAIVLISFLLATRIEHPQKPFLLAVSSSIKLLVFSVAICLLFNTARGMYRKISYISLGRQLFHASRSYLYSIAAVLSALFVSENLFYRPSFLVLFFAVLPPVYLLAWVGLRSFARAMARKGFGHWRTLVVGNPKTIQPILARIQTHPHLGYDIRQVISVPYRKDGDELHHLNMQRMEEAIRNHAIELIVLSTSGFNGSFDKLQPICARRRIAMRLLSPESDYLFTEARLQDFAGLPLYIPPRERIDLIKRGTKRAFDLVAGSLMLLILSPLFLVIAVLTKLESPGPVFFRQRRALSDTGKAFEFIKFRSMHHLADQQRSELEMHNQSNGALFKIKDDPRLTRIGRLIRRHSLDELPQLFNVLKGEMSLVGPRPLPVGDFGKITGEDHMGGYFRQRSAMKPGMTGLWQISGRSHLGFREMVLLDLYYIENQTILFDLEILAQTVPAVIFGKGAY